MSTAMLRDELPKFLIDKGLYCDYVFCTGDIKTAGFSDRGYTDEMAAYIKKVCSAVGVSVERLFIVPGNHDINREIDERKSAIGRVLLDRDAYYDSKYGKVASQDMTDIMKGETDFKDFLARIYSPDRVALYGNADRPHFVVETEDFNVLHVDTTISYTKGHEANDLIIGTEKLYQEIRTVNGSKPTILLTHYPFTSLQQDEKKSVSKILHDGEVRLWLAGHEHDHVVQRVHYIDQMQAGELRMEDKANATFLIGEYDPNSGHGYVTAYTWYPEGWAQYPFLDLDNKRVERYDFDLRTAVNDGLSRESVAAKEANKQFYHRLPDKVEQGLLPRISDGDGVTTFDMMLDRTWNSDTPHVIILADGGMGKTTMLLDYCRNSSEPVLYVPVERLVALGLSIEQYCISSVYGNDADAFRENLFTKYSKPMLTLFVDGLNEVDGKSERGFVLEIQRLNMLKGLRVVVTSRSNFTLRYSMPGYRSTILRPLEDSQVSGYFNEEEWEKIIGTRALHRLLGNPMMVTVYKEICSVIDDFRNVEFLDWILPVRNATDLFHDYYVAQLALMMKRGEMSGERILMAAICINDILPAIAYRYECKRRLNMGLDEFREQLDDILQKVDVDQKCLIPIQEYYREENLPTLNLIKVTDFLTQNLRLLHRDKSVTAFPHQIYRDYLSAQWVIRQTECSQEVMALWNSRKIPYPVMTHIRLGSGEYWKNGIACAVHQAGKDIQDNSTRFLVENLLTCFPRTKESGTPDYSGLCLKGHRLPDNTVGNEKISLSGAIIDDETLGLSSAELTLYTNLCLSEGNEFLAAIAVKDNKQRIQLNIFSLDDGKLVYYHELDKKISKMMFSGKRLFIVSGNIFLFTQGDDGMWHYTGEIGEADRNVTRKLQKAIIAHNTLFLYYYSRMVTYDLRDCHRISIANGKLWENPVEGTDITSLKKTIPWVLNSGRQKDVISAAGDQQLLAQSYGDGGLTMESEGELQLELSRGTTQLLDAAISGDGRRAATLGFHIIGNKRKIQLWDLDGERRSADLNSPPIVNNIHLSETGKWLMGETMDKTWVLNHETGEETWYDEHFVSNHAGRLITYGDRVIRRKGQSLFLLDLQSGEEEFLNCPTANPKMVCFLSNGSLAAVDETGRRLHLWSTRDGKMLSQYMDGAEILSIQPIQSKPFIAVFTDDRKIRIYHTGVRMQYGGMQCLIKQAGETIAKQMVTHQTMPLIADTDGRRFLETRFHEAWTSYGKERGLWKRHQFQGGRLVIDSDILDIAFNVCHHQLVVILANGKIVFCDDKYCKYLDSFKIITVFNVNAYDFTNCVCSDEIRTSLMRNGAEA